MAIPTTWTVTQNPKGAPVLAEWWEVKNDVDGSLAFFRVREEADAYRADAMEAYGVSEE